MDVEPRLTVELRGLQEWCPTLFKSLLRLNTERQDGDLDEQDADEIQIQSTDDYYSPNLCARQPAREMITKLGISNARLSTLPISDPFLRKLRVAYERDWNKPAVLEPGPSPIQLIKNVTFSLPNESHRTTLMDGDLIVYGSDSAIGKIMAVFVHNLGGFERMIFAVVPAREVATDPVLTLLIVQVGAEDSYSIVGLPAIEKPSLYTILIGDQPSGPGENLVLRHGEGFTFLCCAWDVYFLQFARIESVKFGI